VLRWAREARESFPDGDLYVNLRGFDPEAQSVDPAVAAEMLLVGLGVEDIPAAALIGLKRADEAVVAWQRTISIWRDVRDERADALIARLEALR